MNHLQISEIFHSIQGEGKFTGFPSHFIRLSGCNIKCPYCDTRYSWEKGEILNFSEIMEQLSNLPPSKIVTLTGGEPLIQQEIYDFFPILEKTYEVIIIETNGTVSIEKLPSFVHIAMDLKPPSSGAANLNKFDNLNILKPGDEVKILILNKEDFHWALAINKKYHISNRFTLSFTPVYGLINPVTLAEWILQTGEQIRINLQIHKYLWGETRKK